MILTIIGLIGNPLVIYIFSRPKFLKVSMFRYLIAGTIADIVNLLANWSSVFPDAFLVNESSISCKLFYYFYYVPYQVCPWTLALSSADRFLSVKFPSKLKFRNNFNFQLTAIISIIVFISLVNIPIYWYHDLKVDVGCVTTNNTIEIYLDILNALLGAILPFFVMAVSTSLIWYELSKRKKCLKLEKQARYKKDVQLIKTLCIMDIYFLVLNIPYCIYMIICDLLEINAFDTIGLYIVCILTYAFSSCDVFIYLLFNEKIVLTYRKKDMSNTN